MKKLWFSISLLCLFVIMANAQETYPTNGVKDDRSGLYAFTNATIFTSYNQKLDNATLIIKDGKVKEVGTSISIPKAAVVVDCNGKHIYPSFIDLDSDYGLVPPTKSTRKWTDPPQFISNKKGAYGWNEAIRPENAAGEDFHINDEKAKKLRSLGMGIVLTHHHNGIARGTGALVSLANSSDNEVIVKKAAAAHYSFSKGNSGQSYPSSRMGAIALLKQTYLDAEWYKTQNEQVNLSLESWNSNQSLPQIFEVKNNLDLFRADKIGDEFGKQYILTGSGLEYQRLDAIKATNASLILPVIYPDAYDVEDPFDALYVELKQMKHWELAPYNAKYLSDAGISYAFTSAGLKEKKDFLKNIRTAIKKGLSKENALKALTYTPANMVKAYSEIGSLEKNKLANFIIVSGDIFEDGSIHQNWIQGQCFEIEKWSSLDLEGNYQLSLSSNRRPYQLEVSGKYDKAKMKIKLDDTTSIDVKHSIKDKNISLSFSLDEGKSKVRLNGWMNQDEWEGKGKDGRGKWVGWKVRDRQPLAAKEGKKEKPQKEEREAVGTITYPFTAYGWTETPKQEPVVIRNATVWTNEVDGILANTDVLIRDGKIAKIGSNLKVNGIKEIDGTGKHISAGIVDEHSHIAISAGVNEGTQASSAEVSIADVINSEDVNIYRQLAGGVTTSQLLHGSANPIGGQSAIIKFRWGATPEQMKFEEAPGFIKFALGENVKQSNWGDSRTVRFPQTRMGVEQVFMDHLTRAKEYGEALKAKKNIRKDLELQAILEIINKERFITCHSYQQGEINMLMKVAEKFDFRINTFTHILEGYKVADKMKTHGVNASTFSDWWAYKYEVIDAIPHNGAIMHSMGLNTGFNSDDAEMGRRMNNEAAKAVKYGGVSEEDALKFVTLNPAKMLRIDDRVGSIKVGKDADLVIWSGSPLSVYTKAEKTFVDGVCYFDLQRDQELRKEIETERNRLIQKMLAVKKSGGKTQKPKMQIPKLYHCDDVDEESH